MDAAPRRGINGCDQSPQSQVSGKDALSIMKSCRVFVFPSHEEGWGIAISEAMACGLPVIAFDLPVYRFIFGDVIETVPMKDFESFSEKIIKLLDDEEARKILIQRSEAHLSKHDLSDVAAKEFSLIKELLEK